MSHQINNFHARVSNMQEEALKKIALGNKKKK